MPERFFTQHTCPKCGRNFEAPGSPVPGMKMYCKECTQRVTLVNQLQSQLVAQDFSLEQEDEIIAKQINDILSKESSGVSEKDEALLSDLTEKLLQDEKRKKKIVKQIRALQKEKR